jgi:hypothetical protein
MHDSVPVATAGAWTMERRPRLRTALFRAAAIVVAMLVALAMVEIALRVRERIRGATEAVGSFESVTQFCAPRHHCLVPNGHYRHASYEYSTSWDNNSLGMRDREHPLQKPPNTYRILALGDSFVQGHGVELADTMVTHLEASLNVPPRSQTVEVLNGGVFGYSPMLEYLYLRDLIGTLQPDAVIVGFFLGNDVGEDAFYSAQAHTASDGSISFDDREWPWSRIVQALDGTATVASSSAPGANPVAAGGETTWERIKDGLRSLRTVALVKGSLEARQYPARREREFALVRAHRGDVQYDLGLINYPVLDREQRLAYWEQSKLYLGKIAALCREHGVRMILLAIPPVERLTGETHLDEPYAVLDDFGKELAIPVVQLLPDFLGQSPDVLYYPYDRHWTPEGQRQAAQVLDRELRHLDVLPN